MARIIIPTPLRKFTANQAAVETSGSTVSEAIRDLSRQHPEIARNILDEHGELRSFVKIYVGNEDIAALKREQTPVDTQSTISIIPAIAGGSK